MARSTYIYLVRYKATDVVVGAFTVKREAREWVNRWGYEINTVQLSRMRDGGFGDKKEYAIPWEDSDV